MPALDGGPSVTGVWSNTFTVRLSARRGRACSGASQSRHRRRAPRSCACRATTRLAGPEDHITSVPSVMARDNSASARAAAGPYFPLAWFVRGLLDRPAGGAGLRRGRNDPRHLQVDEALHFWRVEQLDCGRLLRLRAEMRLPGTPGSGMRIEPGPAGGSRYHTTGHLRPARSGRPGILDRGRARSTRSSFGGVPRNIARAAEHRRSHQPRPRPVRAPGRHPPPQASSPNRRRIRMPLWTRWLTVHHRWARHSDRGTGGLSAGRVVCATRRITLMDRPPDRCSTPARPPLHSALIDCIPSHR